MFSIITVKDSFAFVEKNHKLSPTDGFMVPYNIKNLFTYVPLVERIEICLSELYHSNIELICCPGNDENGNCWGRV